MFFFLSSWLLKSMLNESLRFFVKNFKMCFENIWKKYNIKIVSSNLVLPWNDRWQEKNAFCPFINFFEQCSLNHLIMFNMIQWIPYQVYEYIARVFNNVVFSTYLRSNAAKNEFNISIAVLHILGLLIYLELKIKSSF